MVVLSHLRIKVLFLLKRIFMKRFAALLAFFILTSCYAPERDCKAFKTGTFEFESFLNGELVTSRFIRNDSIEIDMFQGKSDTASVRWVNDCEYILTNLNPKNMAEEKPLQIRIITTEKNSYTFEYSLVGSPEKQRGTVTRVKE
jgi:hypothetical protein